MHHHDPNGLALSGNTSGGDYSSSANQFNSTVYASHNRKKSITNNGAVGQIGIGNIGNIQNMNATSMNIGFSGGSTGTGGVSGSANSTGNHTAISGGRKPTADSHAYTLYKPNK